MRISAGFGNFPAANANRTKLSSNAWSANCARNWAWNFPSANCSKKSSHAYPEKTVHLKFFICRLARGEPQPLGCAAVKWVGKSELDELRISRRRRAAAGQIARLQLSVNFLDDLAEIVFAHIDDAHFASGVFRRIAGVRGVDHDGRAEFAADGAGRRLGRIGRAKHVADFADGIHAFINQRDALFRAGPGPFFARQFGRRWPDMNRMMFSNWWSPKVGQRISPSCFSSAAAILKENSFSSAALALVADDVLELGAQDFADGAVKFHRLRHAHAVDLDADDVKAGAREEINHVAGPAGRESEIVRLDEHQRALAGLAGLDRQ